MPVVNGQGFGDDTEAKQSDFRYLVGYHLNVVNCMITKARREGKTFPPPEYWYFDITAGCGVHPETGDPGSPVIFKQEAASAGIPFTAWFFDCHPHNCCALRERFHDDSSVNVIGGDHNETLMATIPDVDRPRLGLLYCDPSGNIPPFDLLAAFADHKITSRIDILINVPSTSLKRVYAANKDKGHKHLHEYLAGIPKDVWLIRQPQGKHQWSFIIGTRWASMPEFKRIGMHKIGTPEGDEVLRRLTFSERERDADPVLKLPGLSAAPGVPASTVPSNAAIKRAV